jgi:hypothetical protein
MRRNLATNVYLNWRRTKGFRGTTGFQTFLRTLAKDMDTSVSELLKSYIYAPILQTFSGQVQDVDDEQSEGDDPDVDHKNGPFNVVDQFDLQITPSQFRRLCGLAAMATYQAEWGGQRGHIVHSLSTGELEASEVSQSFQMIERTLTVGSRTKFERFGRANHRYVLFRQEGLRVLHAWEELLDNASAPFTTIWKAKQSSEHPMGVEDSKFLFFDCEAADVHGVVPKHRATTHVGMDLIKWANSALQPWVDRGICEAFKNYKVMRRQYISGAYFEWRAHKGRVFGNLYTWQQFLHRLAQYADTSEEKLLDSYLPSHPNSMFFENDSDVLPEHRHLPPPPDSFPSQRRYHADRSIAPAQEPEREFGGDLVQSL